ncbi:hypothetical protein Ancab_022803 [Ancistrocladus abbreviatus]
MDLHLLPTVAFALLMMAVACHARTPQVYWKTVLGDTPMPNIIKELLHDNKGEAMHINNKSPEQMESLFFMAKDLRPGLKLNVQFTKSITGSGFLPRHVAESLPFTSNKLTQILKYFSIKPESPDAQAMKHTLEVCETQAEGNEKYCATSLESMVDYATSRLGKDVTVQSAEAPKGTTTSYTVVEVKKMGIDDSVVDCHKVGYPYAVFYCHQPTATTPYVLTLVGADGLKFQAPITCHVVGWRPIWLPFKLSSEGKSHVCHFLDNDDVVWVRN